MSTQERARHRKRGAPTQIRSLTIRAAAVGAVALPGAMIAIHDAAAAQTTGQPAQGAAAESAHTAAAGTARTVSPDAADLNELRQVPHPSAKSAAATASKPAAEKPATDAKPAAAKKRLPEYTVPDGYSLFRVARETLGSGEKYAEIFALNRDRAEPDGARLTDPTLIEPGWTLTLPADADTTHAASMSATTHLDSTTTSTHAASARSSATSSMSDKADGDLNDWINQAISVLSAHGYSVSYHAVYETVMHESSGNPDAVNGSDSNAAAGHPSIGLMQTIQSTFDAYALPGYEDIYNPVDNIIAGARYAAAVYGSLDEVVDARCDGSCWRGY